MAAELVGGALLSSFFQVAFERLASREFLDYFRGRRLDETLLKKLNIMLLSINTVIDDAEQKQITHPNVKAWLDHVKDAVHEAEDVLDEIDYEVSKRKLESEIETTATRKVRNFFSASASSFDKEIETGMKKVLENLEYLATQKDILKLKEGGAGLRSIVSERLPTTSLVDEAEIYGRDDDKEMIIKWLLSDNDNSQLSIISIVGMGGLGKTTLAQYVYNDHRVKDDFDLKAWICVSDDFDVTRVTRTIVEAITKSSDDTKDLNMLQIKLKEMLSQKRFLFVLDDVWNESYMLWEALQTPFKHGTSGSKIIVTTRSDIVVSTMRSMKIHPLKQLTEEDSWSLFRRHAFRNADGPHSNFAFEEIGRKIVKKCKGLPLALKTIGRLLYTKLSPEEWNGILKSEIWEEESNILPALRLSYHYLPSHLKRCFAYCSLFPKDYELDKELLIRLWMAENFLQCAHESKDKREVGDQFFNDLLLRSFFQRSSGDDTRFVMHDLINDLAKDVSGKFCHRLEVDKANNLTEMTRHISYLRNSQETSKRFEVIYRADRLRTFLPLSMKGDKLKDQGYYNHRMSSKMIHDLLSKLRCLRVLSLAGYLNIVELPDLIGNLKHLHYLDLSGTSIKKLPDSTCLLYNLQTLKLRNCTSLEKLPSDMHKLMNLRHLDFYNTKVREMPKQLGKLKNLQVLSTFYVGKCSDANIKLLKELDLQGAISILELQNVVYPVDALAANLKNKIYLEELRLEWSMSNDKSQNDKEVLEKLEPHQNLKKLSITNYDGTGFRDWFVDLSISNVVSLKLENCKHCLSLPSLGLLPHLKSLSVIGFDSVVAIGPEFCGNSSCTTPFGSLEILEFQSLVAWEEWKCENVPGAFPRLREFYIQYCPKLKEHLPAQLPSLIKLVMGDCKQLVTSVPQAPSLKVLHIRGSFTDIFWVENIENIIAKACLQELEISYFAKMEFPLRNCHNFLQRLRIYSSCDSLRSFPLDVCPKLQSLELYGCSNLETTSVLEGNHHDLTFLTTLEICKCPKLVSFPIGGFSAPKLEIFHIVELESLKSLPERMHVLFPSLIQLFIRSCPQVESFPEGGLPSNLMTLWIRQCPKLMASRMEWDLHSHTSLQSLVIEDAVVDCFPDPGLLPPTLTSLCFAKCSNLRMLNYNGLCHLSALKSLSLRDCPKLQYLPKEGLPSSLSTLEIVRCPLLKKRCKIQKGKDWAKIAHIPSVQIDDDIVT